MEVELAAEAAELEVAAETVVVGTSCSVAGAGSPEEPA